MELYNELQQRKALEEYNKKMRLEHQFKTRPNYFGYELEEPEPFYELEYQKHPLEGPTQKWVPDQYAGGGIVGIRKPSEIPPERGGLRSIMIGDMDD